MLRGYLTYKIQTQKELDKQGYVTLTNMCYVDADNTIKYSNLVQLVTDLETSHIKNSIIYVNDLHVFTLHMEHILAKIGYNYSKTNSSKEVSTYNTIRTNNGIVYALRFTTKSDNKEITEGNVVTFLGIDKLFPNVDTKTLQNATHVKNIYSNELEYEARCYMWLVEEMLKTDRQPHWTRSSYAFSALRRSMNQTSFRSSYPITRTKEYTHIHQAFFGGRVYNKQTNIKYEDVVQIDRNSSFAAVMANELLPEGEGELFKGEYVQDETRPLYIQLFRATFTLKRGHIPSLPKAFSKANTEVYSELDLINKVLTLSSVDLELFKYNYNIESIEYIGGYSYRGKVGPFNKFITNEYKGKEEAKRKGNKFKELTHKLNMVTCYGKFGQKLMTKSIDVVLNDNNEPTYVHSDKPLYKEKNYLPMAIFIAAYGRKALYTIVKGIEHVWLYGDTDSVHMLSTDYDKYLTHKQGNTYFNGVLIDRYELGAWDLEDRYAEVKYMKDKVYIGVTYEGDLVVKASGITKEAKETITSIDDLDYNKEIKGGLAYKKVRGGTILVDTVKVVADIDSQYGEVVFDTAEEQIKSKL